MPPKASESFKKGDRVKAKWSGSSVFYDAKVLEISPRTCKVQFDDGSVFSVKRSEIKPIEPAKKDAEPRKTRSRSRSAGRPRSRSRSPARTEKKTPTSKNEKSPAERRGRKPKSEKNVEVISTNNFKTEESDNISKSYLLREKIGTSKETSLSSVTTIITNSISSVESKASVSSDDNEPRMRITRLQLRSADATDSKASYEKVNAKSEDAKYSDDEDSEEEKEISSKSPSKLIQALQIFATFLRISIMPLFLLFLVFACTKKQCTVLEIPPFYSKWKDVVNALKVPLPSVVLFHASLCLLSLLPLGRKVTGFPFGNSRSVKEYRLNGLICLILSVIVFGVCSYFGVYMNWGYDKFKSLALGTLLYCIFFSVVLQVVSLIHGNGDAQSQVPLIGNFFDGVYFNPFLYGKVDIKSSFIRAGLIGGILLNLSILLKFFLMKGYVTIPMAITCGMQFFFCLDLFVREEKMLSSAVYTSDKVGYGFIVTNGFLIPVSLALQNIYHFVFESRSHSTPHWCSAAIVALFFVGYYIYMSSSNLKHSFRRNPFSPALSDVDSIPTSKKKRLISSKMWGVVRHPNYLGLIIMVLSWTLPCGFSHFTPYGPLTLLVISLVVRCLRIESECTEKYGPAWKNYTGKVRSRIIPYIF